MMVWGGVVVIRMAGPRAKGPEAAGGNAASHRGGGEDASVRYQGLSTGDPYAR